MLSDQRSDTSHLCVGLRFVFILSCEIDGVPGAAIDRDGDCDVRPGLDGRAALRRGGRRAAAAHQRRGAGRRDPDRVPYARRR